MKKVFCLMISFIMIFAMIACQNKPQQETIQYSANTMAEVAVSYILDKKANIVTRPLTETPLQKITLACVYYDHTGKKIGQIKMIDCTVKEQKNATLWQTACPDNAAFVDCAVYSVEDISGNKHTANGIETWAETVVAAFRAENHQERLKQQTSANATLAESNEYATVTSVTWQNESITVELDIKSDAVSAVYLFALWFDESGAPLETDSCNYCKNGESMAAKIGTDDQHSYLFTVPVNAGSVKLIVQSVNLANDTQWINPYCYEWILYNQT